MRYFAIPFMFLITLSLSGQNFGLDVGLGLGASGYAGDLTEDALLSYAFRVNFAAEAELNLQPNRWSAANLSFLYGNIDGDDHLRPTDDPLYNRNLNFKSRLFELALSGELHVIGNSSLDRYLLSPFVTVGFAAALHNPLGYYEGMEYKLHDYKTEGQGIEGTGVEPYKLINFAVPLGLGTRIRITDRWSAKLDVIMRYTFTDYLDDVSNNYVDADLLRENVGDLSVYLSDRRDQPTYMGQRGNSSANDIYFTYMVTFQYNLMSASNGIYCPKVEKPEF